MHCIKLLIGSTLLFILAACSPEIGSEQWCEQIKAKAVGDITANEAGNYAKHCVL